jgi:NTE family protein
MAWVEEADGVFRGGGVKGLAIAGALQGFAAHPRRPIKRWVNVAGASAGAIIASFLAVEGADAVSKLGPLLDEMPTPAFEDFPPGGELLGGVPNLLFRGHGLAHGEAFRKWFDGVLGHATFAQVKGLPEQGSRLKLTAVDVTNSQLLLLPDDLPRYRLPGENGPIDPDSFPIASAARMSMSIPYFFEPVELVRDQVRVTGPADGALAAGAIVDRIAAQRAGATFDELSDPPKSLIVDGGTLSNFPVWIFDVDPAQGGQLPKRFTFGFTLTGGRPVAGGAGFLRKISPWPVRFGADIFHAALNAWDNRFQSHSTVVRTVTISAGDVGTTEFDLSRERRDWLLRSGRDAAAHFLDHEFHPEEYRNTHGVRPAFV